MKKDEYSHEIHYRLKERLTKLYGTRKAITINIIVTVFANAALYILFLALWSRDTANQQLLSFAIVTVVAQLLIFSFSWLSWRYYVIPAEINREQIETIKILSAKSIDLNVKIDVFPRPREGYASVKVTNLEYDDISDSTLSILDILKITVERSESILDQINPDSAFVSWGGGVTKKGTIIGKGKATFNVAMHGNKKFLFRFDNGTKRPCQHFINRRNCYIPKSDWGSSDLSLRDTLTGRLRAAARGEAGRGARGPEAICWAGF